jgi:hypothetical protein
MRETARFLTLMATASVICAAQTPSTTIAANRHAEAPYTAEYTITKIKTLANGTTITEESSEKVAVDAQGRRMSANTMHLPEQQTPVTFYDIFDPVARTSTNWTSQRKRVTVTSMPEPGQRQACGTSGNVEVPHSDIPRERPVTEQLGTATIQGMEAQGKLITRTIPAGADGNDAPLAITIESWRPIALNLRDLTLREIIDDPRSGKRTRELTNFVQSDPDPSVFEPPAGYEVVNEGPAQITCSSRSEQ